MKAFRLSAFCVAGMLSSFCAHPASAIILYGNDNGANISDPATGVPWANVARVTNSSGSLGNASAIYLGNGYMITADHVDGTHVTFDGITLFEVKPGSQQQVAPGVDLKVFELTTRPDLPPVMLYEEALGNKDLNAASVLVGWGVGRDPSTAINTTSVLWGDNSTQAKRWGTNTTLNTSQTLTYPHGSSSYSYETLRTRLLTSGGANEAAMARNDSGGALFQFIDGNWYLSGVATVVSQAGESRFGNTITGDLNYFARIGTYSDSIQAIIPEPGHLGAGVALLMLGSAILIRRRRFDQS